LPKKILIIEDDTNIANLVSLYAEKEGYIVHHSEDGLNGLEDFSVFQPDFIILDLMLPEMDGIEVAKKIRKTSSTPILMLTAKSEELDKILGLEIGADDYLTKPFSPRELMARIKTILRRASPLTEKTDQTNIIQIHDLSVNIEKMEVRQQNNLLHFSSLEFRLLLFLIQHPGIVFSRDRLMEEIYVHDDVIVFDRTIDVHIKNIRKKLGDDSKSPTYIQSIFGVGYKFVEP
jgi:DNA-binding response OmpR family regulator